MSAVFAFPFDARESKKSWMLSETNRCSTLFAICEFFTSWRRYRRFESNAWYLSMPAIHSQRSIGSYISSIGGCFCRAAVRWMKRNRAIHSSSIKWAHHSKSPSTTDMPSKWESFAVKWLFRKVHSGKIPVKSKPFRNWLFSPNRATQAWFKLRQFDTSVASEFRQQLCAKSPHRNRQNHRIEIAFTHCGHVSMHSIAFVAPIRWKWVSKTPSKRRQRTKDKQVCDVCSTNESDWGRI